MEQAVPYAKQAATLGMPWAATTLFNNLIANTPGSPHLLDVAMDLLNETGPWWSGPLVDPVGQAWNVMAQGKHADAVRMMGLMTPFPASEQQWVALTVVAQNAVKKIEDVLRAAEDQQRDFEAAAIQGTEAIEKEQNDLQTAAKQAGLLVSTVVGDSTASLLREDAKRNEEESKTAWSWGLGVLAMAAIVAIAPLLLHYAGLGPDYSIGALLGAHAGATAALGTFAGVVLARARSRDVARQRANDLSTAMGTMIAYSSQIQDADEKQRFMTTMGQLVLQAHLTVGGSGHTGDESMTGLVALANVMRAPGGTPPSNG